MKILNTKYSGSARARRRCGGAAVECALILPILAMILMGTFELGRGLMVKAILSDAAHKGCRTGIKRDKGNANITTEVINIMQDNGLDSSKFNPPALGSIVITVTDPNGNVLGDALDAPSGSIVKVQVSIPVSSTSWVAPFYLGTGASLESEFVVMMKQ